MLSFVTILRNRRYTMEKNTAQDQGQVEGQGGLPVQLKVLLAIIGLSLVAIILRAAGIV
jgi:hypothetical protein